MSLATLRENIMSYRKLEVDGNVFEYSIGKTHTKIRGVGAYKNDEVGNYHVNQSQEWYDPGYRDISFQIKPADLAAFIKRNQLKVKVENKRRKA
jgi:hypothetical protein